MAPLGGAGGPGGVADEGGVGGGEARVPRGRVAAPGHRDEVVDIGAGVGGPARLPEREDAYVVAALEVQVGGGQRGPQGGPVRGLAQVPAPGAGLADQRDGPGVAQDVPHFG
ncbi:hypothetical protein GCM10020254_65090 [Streptomyces goshikiensis]